MNRSRTYGPGWLMAGALTLAACTGPRPAAAPAADASPIADAEVISAPPPPPDADTPEGRPPGQAWTGDLDGLIERRDKMVTEGTAAKADVLKTTKPVAGK